MAYMESLQNEQQRELPNLTILRMVDDIVCRNRKCYISDSLGYKGPVSVPLRYLQISSA